MAMRARTGDDDRAAGVLLGAAVGDAAGWPFERADRTQGRADADGPDGSWFVDWRRNAGNRFRPFMEDVAAGEYSDDTQMTIAVARARLRAGDAWADWLERVEWPFLPHYERGAGATVKRACRAWASGQAPWAVRKADERRKYAASGANGVAMRVAPHVLAHHADEDFAALAQDVVVDGVLTHGHPRALLGALLQAYALWSGIRSQAPVAGAELVRSLADGAESWGRDWWERLGDAWRDAVEEDLDRPYGEAWAETRAEVTEQLARSSELLESGAEPVEETLVAWGLTKRASNGSGTLCAVAAAHLAARVLPSDGVGQDAGRGQGEGPARAVLTAARLPGADTDTLASMTASLIGAHLGTGWLGKHAARVQDASLLEESASRLTDGGAAAAGSGEPVPTFEQARAATAEFTAALATAAPGTRLALPDDRSARVTEAAEVRGGSWRAHRTRMTTEDGQSLVLLHGAQRD